MTPDPDLPANPYPGLRPFRADETSIFFGRDEQRIELLQRLRQSRMLAVVGTSGSGKSSLVRAGLLPGLHGGFMAGPTGIWRVADLRPGGDPIGNLARALDRPGALRDEALKDDEISFTETTLRRSSLGLVEARRQARRPQAEKLLVLVDQFEELFRAAETRTGHADEDAQHFINLLLEAARQDEFPIYIVLTMRSDFLGDCARFRGLPEAINRGLYLVPRLTRDQIREAIVGPAAVFGAGLSTPLVNRLLNDVGDDSDQLPILQHALMRTWEYRRAQPGFVAEEAELSLDDYEKVGGMAKALSLHANAILDELLRGQPADVQQQRRQITRALFQRLSGYGAGSRLVRRLATLGEVMALTTARPEEVRLVVDAFRAPQNSLLMPPSPEPLNEQSTLDISHESLLRNWDMVQGWVKDEHDAARTYTKLCSQAEAHRNSLGTLLGERELGVVRGKLDPQTLSAAWARRYNDEFEGAMDFLHASQRRVDRRAHWRRLWRFYVVLGSLAGMAFLLGTWAKALQASDQALRSARAAQASLQALAEVAMADGQQATESAEQKCAATGALPEMQADIGALCHAVLEAKPDDKLRLMAARLGMGRWDEGFALAEELDATCNKHGAGLMQLAGLMAPLATSADRSGLLRLGRAGTGLAAAPSGSQAHPIHRRLDGFLASKEGPEPLGDAEGLLLRSYCYSARSQGLVAEDYNCVTGWGPGKLPASKSAANPFLEQLEAGARDQPAWKPYVELAQAADKPESRWKRAWIRVQTATASYLLLILPVLLWLGLYFWRRRQRRLKRPALGTWIAVRRALAWACDLALAIGLGVLVNGLASSLYDVASLGGGQQVDDKAGDAIGFIVGVLAGVLYWLLKDRLLLRYRRSLGMAAVGLRLIPAGAEPAGSLPWRSSVKRGLPWLLFPLGLVFGPEGGVVAVVLLLLLALVEFGWALFHRGQTLIDRWVAVRTLDADALESLALRP